MALGLMGLKEGMTQWPDAEGRMYPVTVLRLGPCRVLQIRDVKRDKYDAIQLGFIDKSRKRSILAERGHVASDLVSKRKAARIAKGVAIPPKANCEPQRYIKECRLKVPAETLKIEVVEKQEGDNITWKEGSLAVGAILRVESIFKGCKAVDVSGRTKGRGFTGAMKRHNFGGLRGSHGVKKGNRQRGSIASNASNRGSGRPKKGIRMAGQYGNENVTSRNLKVVKIDAENNLMLVMGAVPGPVGSVVFVRATKKVRSKHVMEPQKQVVSAAKKAAAAKKKK